MIAFIISFTLLSSQLVLAEYTDPHCGGKQVIVQLFMWKWSDVANECERFLSKKGFCAVQVSPPNEHPKITKDYMRPWWERYQPVSYKLTSRSGTEEEFKEMVSRCKNVGVRIIVDAVVNHMAGLGRIGVGTAGSTFNSDNYDFPAVPFSTSNFHHNCPSGDGNVNNYGDPNNVRNCNLVGLTDLDGSQDYVRQKVADYFNHLIDLGVSGFRVDAAKHMWPADIHGIEEKLKDLPEGGRPFFAFEVIDRNDGAVKVTEYTPLGYVTEFRYCQKVAHGVNNFGELNNVYDPGWGMTEPSHAFVFVDNHDNQRGNSNDVVTFKNPRAYKLAQAFTLAYNYGFVRVMSSYEFGNDGEVGPPYNADYSIKDVTINGDGTCGNGWVCEHRWHSIGNMVAFRNAVVGTSVDHWRNQNDQISFSRGQKGFFAMAKQGHMDEVLHTGLPAGQYCDLITDCAKKITVDASGDARIQITNSDEPVVAFIVGGASSPSDGAMSGGSFSGTGGSGSSTGGGTGGSAAVTGVITSTLPPVSMSPDGYSRTVIMIQAPTVNGQNVFIDGGIDHGHRSGCTQEAATSKCAIPIRGRNVGTGSHYEAYNAWKKGDNFLDWYGPESGQGSYHGVSAAGTPAVWTTNQPGGHGYTPLNTYGQHYWLVDVDMDCSKTEGGWFEFKGLINHDWEGDVRGMSNGCGTGNPPYQTNNHWAKCGYKNVFHYNQARCEITVLN